MSDNVEADLNRLTEHLFRLVIQSDPRERGNRRLIEALRRWLNQGDERALAQIPSHLLDQLVERMENQMAERQTEFDLIKRELARREQQAKQE